MSTKKGRFWKKEWSLFDLTSDNRVNCRKIETEIVETERLKDYIVYTIGFGYGKGVKLKDLNKKDLVEEIYRKYVVDLKEGEEKRNDIGYVLEYWTSDYHRKWTGFFKFKDAKSVLLREISRNCDGGWMLMFIDIRQKLNKEVVVGLDKIGEYKEVRKRYGRGITLHTYIVDFGSFLRIRGRVSKNKTKLLRELEKSYLCYFNKETGLNKRLGLDEVGIYYMYKSGLRLKVLDKRFIYSRNRWNRKVYNYFDRKWR